MPFGPLDTKSVSLSTGGRQLLTDTHTAGRRSKSKANLICTSTAKLVSCTFCACQCSCLCVGMKKYEVVKLQNKDKDAEE